MAEKFFEELLAQECPSAEFNYWLLKQLTNPSSPCTIEEFSSFYLNLVKAQTDEFIKSNTSTCNTPRRMTMANIGENVIEFISQTLSNEIQIDDRNDSLPENPVDEAKERPVKRQSSRDLFVKHEVEARANQSSYSTKRKSGPVDSSTPVRNFTGKNLSIEMLPYNTSTPKNSKNTTKTSVQFCDQITSRTFHNSSRNSLDLSSRNNSNSRRNTSNSSLCFGDFWHTSANSNSGKGRRRRSSYQSSTLDQTPKFSTSDFPSLKEDSFVEQKPQPRKNESKPKKRVVPITISRSTTPGPTTFTSSSFQSDNNLSNLTASESMEVGDMKSERRKMCDQRDAISKDFSTELEPQRNLHSILRASLPAAAQSTESPCQAPTFNFDESRVERKEVLTIMAKIYSFLLDMNMVPNILSEYSYLFSLLNTEHEPIDPFTSQNQSQNKLPTDEASNLLKNLHNCIFFTVHVLNCQKLNLALLDIMTLRVLIDNEKIQQLATELHDHVRLAIQRKSELDTSNKMSSNSGNNISKVVFFQQETDNRDNFPSDREFGAFKKQRDMFYQILRTWELKHLDQDYDFRKVLGVKIRTLITSMEHPINMAHLARLFTAQLIISCNFDNSANELQMVLPNIDLSKLSKLRQRLVAPSQFSTQYLFPGNQAFFRDFIICCDNHLIFMEQLKISLISELMQINNSSMETLRITSANDDVSNKKSVREEFIVRAETMTTMRVLGKFVGFVVSRAFTFDGYRNTLVDQKQSQIRNLLHPDFDVKKVVLQAIDGRKLLVTIPWLVEYLAMLDFITIRLDYYRELFQLLHTVYMRVNVVSDQGSLCVMPTSKFIIRTCLGWLFENPDIPEEYSNYRNFKPTPIELELTKDSHETAQLNPHLENILNASCPFLADFRVSMMPQRTTKAVSRTGRYRHITTKFQDKSCVQKTKVQDSRERLVEAFMASQSLSVRKIVDFAIDRVSSAVVKDFQVKHLIATRKQAKTEVEQLESSSSTSIETLMKKIIEVYQHHLERLQEQWNEDFKTNCMKRIQGTFESLLPIETLEDVKKTLINITFEKTDEKLLDWCSTNIASIEIFSKDILEDATKLKENQQNGYRRTASTIIIDLSAATMPSDYFKDLQILLHKSSLHPENIQGDELNKSVEAAMEVLEKQTLPSNAYRNIGFYTLQLILQCIVYRVDLLTEEYLKKVITMWRHEKLSVNVAKESQNRQYPRKVDDFIFSNVLSPRFILIMEGKSRRNFEAYGDFLVVLVKENFITTELINEQSVRLYKHEWSKQSLDNIAFLIDRVKSSLSSAGSPESQLFLELVVDLARDMENF